MAIDRKAITKALEAKGATRPCERCGNSNFTLLEEFSGLNLQKDFGTVSLGGPSVPAAIIICTNCGNITLHALGALGLLPKERKEGGSDE
jgi:hypothetical protein